jgi:hypothetical protein
MTDSLLYQANYKLGIMSDVYKDYYKATISYRNAMKYSKNPAE